MAESQYAAPAGPTYAPVAPHNDRHRCDGRFVVRLYLRASRRLGMRVPITASIVYTYISQRAGRT